MSAARRSSAKSAPRTESPQEPQQAEPRGPADQPETPPTCRVGECVGEQVQNGLCLRHFLEGRHG